MNNEPTNQIDKHDFTVRQLADTLGCSVGTVKNRIRSGYINARKLLGGRDWRIPWVEVERLKAEKHPPISKGAILH